MLMTIMLIGLVISVLLMAVFWTINKKVDTDVVQVSLASFTYLSTTLLVIVLGMLISSDF